MRNTFSLGKIDRFRREAKAIAATTGIRRSAALESIAHREGYKDWALLKSSATPQESAEPGEAKQVEVLTLDSFRQALTQFIKTLSAGGVRDLCGGGCSLWVRVEEVANGTLKVDNIEVLGPASDLAYQRHARQRDLLLAIDYEGMSEGFVFPEDVDDDGEPIQPDASSVKFTTKEGRAQLLEALNANGESDYEGLMDKFNLFFEEH